MNVTIEVDKYLVVRGNDVISEWYDLGCAHDYVKVCAPDCQIVAMYKYVIHPCGDRTGKNTYALAGNQSGQRSYDGEI